jgi:predicted nucleic acid-binding protein
VSSARASREVFVDTGAWFAVQVPDDHWHEQAARALRLLLDRGSSLVTTNLVVGETYTLLRRTAGASAAFGFADRLTRSGRLVTVHVDEDMEARAWELLRRFDDHDFSFVDATSFVVMRARRLTRALAFDRHFVTAGFVRVPADEKV